MPLEPESLPEDAEQFENTLQSLLYRWDCPPPELLGDYRLKLTDPPESAAIEQHLEHCALCRDELHAFDQLLADDDLPPEDRAMSRTGPAPSARALPLLSSQMPARRAALRGEDAEPARFVFESDVTVYLFVEAQLDHFLLLGQMAVSPDHRAIWNGALVEVWFGAELAATATVDEDSTFRCTLSALQALTVRIIAHDGNMLVCSIDP